MLNVAQKFIYGDQLKGLPELSYGKFVIIKKCAIVSTFHYCTTVDMVDNRHWKSIML